MSENRNQGKRPQRPAGQRPAGAPRPDPRRARAPQDVQNRQAPHRPQRTAPVRGEVPEPVIKRQQPQQRPQPGAGNPGTPGDPMRRPQQMQGQPRPAQRPPQRRPQPAPEVKESFGSVVRGIVAVAATCFVVCVIVIMFANTIFVSDAELQKTAKTGHLTETEYEVIESKQQLRDEVVTTKATKKKKTTKAEEKVPEETNDLPDGIDTSIAGTYVVNSPVYLHPAADANSENLATLPSGAQVKVFGQSFGWYYVEYEGQKGYAWGTFFNPAG